MAAPTDWLPCENAAGEDIPSYAVAKVTGVTGGFLQLGQVDADDEPNVAVASEVTIPEGEGGEATLGPRVLVAYDAEDGTPAAGETWGPQAGNWRLKKDYEGFLILGGAGGGVVNALRVSAAAEAGSALPWKEPVRCATTASGTLATAFADGQTVDGVTLATGDRVLVKNQSSGAENGIYTVNAAGAPTRATDADAGSELLGATVWVSEGTHNADTIWSCTNNATISAGVTALVWVRVFPEVSLGTVTVTDTGTGHTVREQTFSGLTLTDPAATVVTYTGCRSTTGTALPVNTVVVVHRHPLAAGTYQITPAGYATAALPGLVSAAQQDFGGLKIFNAGIEIAGADDTSGGFPGAAHTVATALAAAPAAYSPTAPDGSYWKTTKYNGATPKAEARCFSGYTGSVHEYWVMPDYLGGATSAGVLVLVGRYGVKVGASVYSGDDVTHGINALNSTFRGGILTQPATSTADPNADRIVFWDDSAGQYQYLDLSSDLAISGTTLSTTGLTTSFDILGDDGTLHTLTFTNGLLTDYFTQP